DPEAEPSDLSLGVVIPTKTYVRSISGGNTITECLEVNGDTFDMRYAVDDLLTQTPHHDQMITQRGYVLSTVTITRSSLPAHLHTAAAERIPTIDYDRLLTDSENVDFYVTFDNYEVGVNQATSLLDGLGLLDENFEPADDAPEGPLSIELFAGSLDDNNAHL